jgi:hypothetical protein
MMSSEKESTDEEKPESVLLDVEEANLRNTAGVTVQTIPKRWVSRRDLESFFMSDLEIVLVRVDGIPHIEIRIKQEEVK